MDDLENTTSNIKLYRTQSLTVNPQDDTYINANDQDKNYGKSDVLMADDQ